MSGMLGPEYFTPGGPGHGWAGRQSEQRYMQEHGFDPETGGVTGPLGAPPAGIALQVQTAHEQAVEQARSRLGSRATGYLQGGLGLLQSFRPGGATAMESGMYGQIAQSFLSRASMLRPTDMMADYRRHEAHQARKSAKKAGTMQLVGKLAGAAIQAGAMIASGGAAGAAAEPGTAGQLGAAAGGGSNVWSALGGFAQGAGNALGGYFAGQAAGAGVQGAAGGANAQQSGAQPQITSGQQQQFQQGAQAAVRAQAGGVTQPNMAPGQQQAPSGQAGPGQQQPSGQARLGGAGPSGGVGGTVQGGAGGPAGGPQPGAGAGGAAGAPGGGMARVGGNGDFGPLAWAATAANDPNPIMDMSQIMLGDYLADTLEGDPDWDFLDNSITAQIRLRANYGTNYAADTYNIHRTMGYGPESAARMSAYAMSGR